MRNRGRSGERVTRCDRAHGVADRRLPARPDRPGRPPAAARAGRDRRSTAWSANGSGANRSEARRGRWLKPGRSSSRATSRWKLAGSGRTAPAVRAWRAVAAADRSQRRSAHGATLGCDRPCARHPAAALSDAQHGRPSARKSPFDRHDVARTQPGRRDLKSALGGDGAARSRWMRR